MEIQQINIINEPNPFVNKPKKRSKAKAVTRTVALIQNTSPQTLQAAARWPEHRYPFGSGRREIKSNMSQQCQGRCR